MMTCNVKCEWIEMISMMKVQGINNYYNYYITNKLNGSAKDVTNS